MIRDRHDSRPRIHVRAGAKSVTYQHGPRGMKHRAESVGAAVEAAIGALDGRDAVIFYSREAA